MIRLAAFVFGLLCASAQGAPPAQPVTAPTGPQAITSSDGSAVPTALTAGQSWSSKCVPTPQFRAYTWFVSLAAAGTISTQRYADAACTMPLGAAVPASPQALAQSTACPAAGYCGGVSQNDGVPFMGIVVTMTDTSAATNAVRRTQLLLGAK